MHGARRCDGVQPDSAVHPTDITVWPFDSDDGFVPGYRVRVTEQTTVAAGWYPDPTKRHELRYWDGATWTDHVHTAGTQGVDRYAPAGTGTAYTADAGLADEPAQNATGKVPLFGARKHAERLSAEVERLRGLINQYGLRQVEELDAMKAQLRGELDSLNASLARARAELDGVRAHETTLRASVLDLRNAMEIQEFGLYDYEHPAEDSIALSSQLAALRADIKSAVRDGRATSATANFTFNNSTSKGAKFVRDMSKLILRSYNAEAENCVKAVKAGNLGTAQARLTKAMEQIERLGKMIDLRITPYYHQLRLRELELANRHLLAVQAEKEAERAHREELREQRKAEKELQAEKERLEKERTHYLNTLAALEAKGDQEAAERLRAKLADVEHAIENVDYRAANIRAGYVYVISNVGSFGPDIVKIGLTRRLDPMDRVNELGDASVPFRFDVHALFFADDAVSIEAALHQHFADRRVNKVNMRREYFRATPEEVKAALAEHNVELLDFSVEPAADEYRASQALLADA